jgi:hypothetical protein
MKLNAPKLKYSHAHMVAIGRRGGRLGGPARARALSPKRRSEIAAMGARATNAGKG